MPGLRRPCGGQHPSESDGRTGHRSQGHGRNLRYRLLVPSALLHGHLRLPHHPRTRSRHRHGCKGSQPPLVRMADHRRRRLHGHRRQPLHPLGASQRGHQRHPAQQQDLRSDQGTVLPHLGTWIRLEILALRYGGRSLYPGRAHLGCTGQLLRPFARRGNEPDQGSHDRCRPSPRGCGS